MARNIDPGIALIKEFESFKPKPYLCPAGVPTIGYGTTIYPNGKKVTLQDTQISEESAVEYLRAHIQKDIDLIESFLSKNKIVLNDNEFSALVDFSYNLGPAAIIQSGKSLNAALLSKDPSKVVQAFRLYVKMKKNGVTFIAKGLKRRREAEVSLYLS
jgi:lysozyme